MELQDLNHPEDIERQPAISASQPVIEVDDDGTPLVLPEDIHKGEDGQTPHEREEEAQGYDGKEEEDHGDQKPKSKFDEPGRVRRFSTILNLLNSLLGAGILGVPYAMNHSGIIPSIFLLIFVDFLSCICTILNVKLQKMTDATGFDDLAFKILGKAGQMALSILQILFLYSAQVSFLIIGSDSIMSWLRLGGIDIAESTGWRALCVFLFWLVLPGLLSIPKQIKFLSYFSYLNFVCIGWFVLVMIIKAIQVFPKNGLGPGISYGKFGIGICSAIAVFGLAFSLPAVSTPILNVYNKDTKKRTIVAIAASILCFVIIAIPGIIGYLMFGKDTKDVVLNTFDDDDVLITITRAGFVAIVCCSFPCIAQSIMASWGQMIYKINVPSQLSGVNRLVVWGITNAIPVILAMFLPNAGPLLSIGGAMGGILVDFLFPALMWIKVSKNKLYHWDNVLCIILCVFAVVAAAIATYLAVVDCIDAFK